MKRRLSPSARRRRNDELWDIAMYTVLAIFSSVILVGWAFAVSQPVIH